MTDLYQTNDLPETFKTILDSAIKAEGFEDFDTVISPASSKGENYLGLLFRIHVTCNKSGGKLHLILKIPLQSKVFREKFPLARLYIREVLAYTEILPKFKAIQEKYQIPKHEEFRFIKCYSASSEHDKEYLLMEDENECGFKMTQRRASLDYQHLKLIIENLAKFHSLSFVLKTIDPQKFSYFAENSGGLVDYDKEYIYFFSLAVDRAVNVMENENMATKVKEFGVDIYEKLQYYMNADSVENYTVLCHGDCWTNNVLFKYEDNTPIEARLLDWQMIRCTSPVVDLAYLIFSSTDEELRKEHFNNMMDYYHDSLAKHLNLMGFNIEECYPKPIFQDHLKKILPFGLLLSFVLIPAVIGEAEDVPDMDNLLKKDRLDASDLKFENKQASNRYSTRMNGVVQTFIDMNLI